MKAYFVINPISGTGKQNNISKLLKGYFLLCKYEVFYTKYKGHATEIASRAVERNIDLVVAVGGDGTVNECAKSLIDTDTVLAIIPTGSGNGFAYHFKIHHKLKDAIKQLNTLKTKNIDSCLVNNNVFVNIGGIGFDAHIANLFYNLKNRGFFSYIKLIFKELSYKAKNYELEYNGGKKHVNAFMISFANTSQYGNGARIAPNAKAEDGLIDFVIVKRFPKWQIFFFLLRVKNGYTHLSKYVEIIRVKEMKIKSSENLVHLDGEPKTIKNPIIVKVSSKKLKILAEK